MNQNQLFQRTRWRLASWYAGVMGVILSLSGVGVYEAIAHAHWVTLDREIESIAGTLHDSLEPLLEQPGRLEPGQVRSLPDVCIVGTSCFNQESDGESHRIGVLRQEDYYLRFLNRSGQLIAFTKQLPEGLPPTARDTSQPQWHTLTDSDGTRYRKISLLLHTQDNRFWGYLQVGRSIKDFDDYLAAVRWIMLLGLPIALFLIGICSWGLAGLAMKPIYQSYRQIQQFTADAAHELRTPLAAIQATIESTLRLNQINESESRETLRVVGRQNYRLSQLVDALLLLCRMNRQELLSQQNAIVKSECVSLNDLLSDIAEELAPLAMAADVNLTTDIRVSQPLEVMGNEEQLYRLVSNLVTNAIQYTPAHGKVILILDKNQPYALIKIQDTGIGIAPEDHKQIFDRFYRVSSDRSRKTGGFGLGLPIAAAIAQAHQGSIQVQSELGKGSTFTIRLLTRAAIQ